METLTEKTPIENRITALESIVTELKQKVEDPQYIKRRFAALGGKSKSEAKAKASRENGKKGGKTKVEPEPQVVYDRIKSTKNLLQLKTVEFKDRKPDDIRLILQREIFSHNQKEYMFAKINVCTSQHVSIGQEYALECDPYHPFKIANIINNGEDGAGMLTFIITAQSETKKDDDDYKFRKKYLEDNGWNVKKYSFK